MNYMCQEMPIQAMYVPSQVPVSQMPMYNQFPPNGEEPTVTMSTYVPQETSLYCPVPLPSEVPPKPMYGTQFAENYQNTFENVIRMLKDPRYQKKSEAFLKVYAQHQCEPEEDSAYDESEYSLDENPKWEVPPEEDNQNTEVYGNEFYAPVCINQFANQLSRPCNNYYESLAEDDNVSDDKMDAYDEEMYEEFEDEVEQEDEMLFYPQEPSRMPPGFTKEHTGYNTY